MSYRSSTKDKETSAWCDDVVPAVVLSSGQPESSLTAVALRCQMVWVPAGHLQKQIHI